MDRLESGGPGILLVAGADPSDKQESLEIGVTQSIQMNMCEVIFALLERGRSFFLGMNGYVRAYLSFGKGLPGRKYLTQR